MSHTRDVLLKLLKEPTDRDKQVSIGASNASNPCARCLAEDLTNTHAGGTSQYWAGAVIGTAVHGLLEERVRSMYPTWMPEQKVVIGELPGYGVVKSTTDLYIPTLKKGVDWKTTTKKKLPALKEALTTEPSKWDTTATADARFKATAYIAQLHLYGRGVINAGYEVESVAIGFVCRDAQGDNDIWATEDIPYDPEYSDKVWGRLQRLWAAVQDGRDPSTFDSHPKCWYCNVMRDND